MSGWFEKSRRNQLIFTTFAMLKKLSFSVSKMGLGMAKPWDKIKEF
jgi:hypothetical protein